MMELTGFRVVSVFALEQTEGKELPSIGVDELSGDVRDYHKIFNALVSMNRTAASEQSMATAL